MRKANRRNEKMKLSWSSGIFFIPPFLLSGSFIPQNRFYWLAIPIGFFLSFIVLCLIRFFLPSAKKFLPILLFPVSLLLLTGTLIGSCRYIHLLVLPDSPRWLFPVTVILCTLSASLALKDTSFLFRLAGIHAPILFSLLFLSAMLSLRKTDFHLLSPVKTFFPFQSQQGFFLTILFSFALSFFISLLLLNIPDLSVTPAGLRSVLLPVSLILCAVYASSTLALGPIMEEMLPYPWYAAPGLDLRAGYLDRQELYSCGALLLSLPPYILFLLNSVPAHFYFHFQSKRIVQTEQKDHFDHPPFDKKRAGDIPQTEDSL